MKLILTTNPGIEDIVSLEAEELLRAKSENFMGLPGRVLVKTGEGKLPYVFKMRSIYHVIKLVKVFPIRTSRVGLKDIYENLRKISLEELNSSQTFRITSERIGSHSFTSVEVQRFAGKAIVDRYSKKVDLKNFDVNIRCDVIGRRCVVGVQLTRDSLHKRYERPFNHPAAIKHPLAYALIRLAEVKDGDRVLDPFCGGGTIPIEIASIYDGKVKVVGSDINERYIEGAKLNASAAKVKRFIKFKVADARKLDKVFRKVDKIVTNPPYGVRMWWKNMKRMYEEFLISASRIVREKIVVMNLRADSFRTIIFRTKKFYVSHERVVESGGLYPHIFVLEKL